MPAPAVVAELVERFQTHGDIYRSADYNEAQLRQDFLNPFFQALGWDVYNRQGYAQPYREVIHEAAIKMGGHTKAPDYCFRAGGAKPSFFVEAKKPSIDIRHAPSPAYQLRRYAWSAKLPVSMLTDFEELAVYDCRIRPVKTDGPATARIIYHHYTDYLEHWDELAGLFSPEAIRRGALDRFIASKRVKKGTAEVDAAFLTEIEAWRELLARNVALRNPGLTQRELNFAVQRTIDRIIFLRICEDRGIERYATLQSLVNGTSVYRRLGEIFQRADERYNSGLFYFTAERGRADPPDDLTLALTIDDKPLKDIVRGLYFPDSPYEFSVLPAEILGHVYEQFLGKVIRLTSGHRAKVEEKPEVRKAGGVYYTPAYIVDYIVEHTVGRLVHGDAHARSDPIHRVERSQSSKGPQQGSPSEPSRPRARAGKPMTPRQAARLRILDPACGSGSFLIGAYQYLLDWHRDWYTAHDPEKHARGRSPKLYRASGDQWRLTTAEKKRILLNNIYGVDIDPQAVEVTKLSLLLKVLEGESEETIQAQLRLFHERALPDLGSNIKCGNSLIGPDFYEGRQRSLLEDEEERWRINAFDWQAEFPEVFKGKNPGFDAVIGNPPYVVIGKDFDPHCAIDYLQQYQVSQYKTDLFHLFIQKGIDLLAAEGRLGYIVPNPWLTLTFTDRLRSYVLSNTRMAELVIFQHRVFEHADVDTCLLLLSKGAPSHKHKVRVRRPQETTDAGEIEASPADEVLQSEWTTAEGCRIETRMLGKTAPMVRRLLQRFPALQRLARASLGCQAYNRSKHTAEQIRNRVFHAKERLGDDYLPELAGKDVGRYVIRRERGEWIKYGPWLHDYRTPDWLSGPRVLVREIPGAAPYRIQACYAEETYCNYKTVLNVNPSEVTDFSMKYLLGVLNSKLISFLYPLVSNKMLARSFPRLSVGDLRRLPIRPIDFSDASDRARHDRMVALVERMLTLHRELAAARTPQEKTAIQRRIEATDRQIDRLVYELYELTDEEIAIVEQS